MADFISAAIRYVDLGFGVLPVDGKKGFLKGGWKAAAHDATAAGQLFAAHPGKNIALVLPASLCVIDIDPRNGGDESLARWEDEHGTLPETVMSRTGGGGKHLYFRCDPERKLQHDLAPGLDLIGQKAQVTEWPSATDAPYEWIAAPWEFPYADLPDVCYAPAQVERPKTNGHGSHQPDAALRKYCYTALANEKQRLATAPKGGRNAALNNSALALGHLAHYQAFGMDEARAALKAACTDNGLIGDDGAQAFETTFASGWTKGETEPADIPDSRPRPAAAAEPVSLAARRDETWLDQLQRGERGYRGNDYNAAIAIQQAPELSRRIGWDIRQLSYVNLTESPAGKPGRWTDTHTAKLAVWLQSMAIPVTTRHVETALAAAARGMEVDPLAEYLNGVKWDGQERIEKWLAAYCNSPPTLANALMGSKFLIGAVARALSPGCKMDSMLVLEGHQGHRKSTAIKILGGEFTGENLPDFHSKDAMLIVGSKWIVEVSELAAKRRSEQESIKAFITRREDTFRTPYARHPITVPRWSVLIGNYNPDGVGILDDTTGGRRYWVVPVSNIDTDALTRDRDQLWAEAVHCFRRGDAWWLSTDEAAPITEEQADRRDDDPWMEEIRAWMNAERDNGLLRLDMSDVVTTTEIATKCLNIPLKDVSRSDQMRIARCLHELGLIRSKTGPQAARINCFRRISLS